MRARREQDVICAAEAVARGTEEAEAAAPTALPAPETSLQDNLGDKITEILRNLWDLVV